MDIQNIKATGRLRKLLDVSDHTRDTVQKRQTLTVDMRSLQESAQTSDAQNIEDHVIRPVTSRGKNNDNSYINSQSSPVTAHDKLVRFQNQLNRTQNEKSKRTEAQGGSSDGILIIHGAIHKISIHGDPYVPRASNKAPRRMCGKNRAPTPYPHREVEEIRRQEMVENAQYEKHQNIRYIDREPGSPTSTQTYNSQHPQVCGQSRINDNSKDRSGRFVYGKESHDTTTLETADYRGYERSGHVNQGQIIGQQASNRLVCHGDRHTDDMTYSTQALPADVEYERQKRSEAFVQQYRNGNIVTEQRTRRPDPFERRHGVSLDSFVLPKVGQRATRQQLGGCSSDIIATKESNADAHTSSEVDLLLQQLGWCHGEKGQTEGWISPQQQEMNIQKINNSLKGEGRPEEVIKEVTRDTENNEKKDVAEFRVKIRKMWQKLFH